MNYDEPIQYKKQTLIVLSFLTVLPVLISALPATTINALSNFISANITNFYGASHTSFPQIAIVYYFFVAISILIQTVMVVWYCIRLPANRLKYLREIYEADERWLSFNGITLLNRKFGTLLVCVVFFVGTWAAMFYLGPGYGLRKDRRQTTEILMFFCMNSIGVISLMLYAGLFTMWSRLIHLDKDI